MNLKRACGFLLVGLLLGYLPRMAPGWCVANGVDGSSVRTLWLGLMSAVQIGIAVAYFMWRASGPLLAAARYEPGASDRRTDRPDAPWAGRWTRPAARTRRAPVERLTVAATRRGPAAFEAGLAESRRAA